ncbi:MAG: M48 family metalloprotease [Cucumibacter sp.]
MILRQLARYGLGLALAAMVAGCTLLTGEPEIGVTRTGELQAPPAVEPASEEAAALAGENARIVAGYGGVYRDRDAEIMVAQIVGRLLTAGERANDSFAVTILDSPQVNAFALPGGNIFVTRGILALASDASELAAVLSHEMAHVTLRHAQARSNRVRTTQIVDRVLGGILGVDLETDQSSNRARLSLASFSQQQELDADAEGIRVAALAGFDPASAGRFLGVMGRYAALTEGEDASGQTTGDFLSSHPSTPSRIERAVALANEAGGADGETGRDIYLASIDGIAFGNNPDTGAVIGNRFVHKQLELTFIVPQRYALTDTDDAVVATSPDGAAMRFDGAEVPPEMGLENYLNSGWIAGLVAGSVRSERIGGTDFVAAEARTESWVFKLAALRHDGQVYRFIFAAAAESAQFTEDFRETIESFRRARPADSRRVRSFQITVVAARADDTVESLAGRMEVLAQGAELFYALNGLFPGDPITVGAPYKIVTLL